MTIEEAIEHMMHVWEQLKEKAIKLGTAIRKVFHDVFGQKEVSLELPKKGAVKKKKTVSSERKTVRILSLHTDSKEKFTIYEAVLLKFPCPLLFLAAHFWEQFWRVGRMVRTKFGGIWVKMVNFLPICPLSAHF